MLISQRPKQLNTQLHGKAQTFSAPTAGKSVGEIGAQLAWRTHSAHLLAAHYGKTGKKKNSLALAINTERYVKLHSRP